jgi:riboflavin kinase/FMN adenylyltransferase
MSGFTISSTVDSIAIGNFDGMHLGHKALFEKLTKNGGVVVIEHFRATLTPHIYRTYFTNLPIFFYDFDSIRNMAPETFVERLVNDFPKLQRIVIGEDFLFGLNRRGDSKLLKKLFSGEVVVIDEVKLKDIPIHSSLIRNLIESGDIEKANIFLGREYEIWGEVVSGQGIGKEKLLPTINLTTGRFLLPKPAVYATKTNIDGKYFDSVTFIGHRVTTDGNFSIETHIIDKVLGNIKGKVSIRFKKFIRQNRKFASLDELKKQIIKDIEVAYEKR